MKVYTFNEGWLFSLNGPVNSHLLCADTTNFSEVDIPHDWSIELPFTQTEGEMCTGFLPGGFGWYRKVFTSTEEMNSKLVYIYFDGIYNNATIYCNGKYIEMHPYGYTPFYYDITEYLNPVGEDNIIAVSVDRTRYADSRWYTGSGIYRDVELRIANKVHFPIWGAVIKADKVTGNSCTVKVDINVINSDSIDLESSIEVQIFDKYDNLEATAIVSKLINSESEDYVYFEIPMDKIVTWSPDNPYLYKCCIELSVNGSVCDSYKTTFGIRKIEFDSHEGFILNGENTLIKGVCLHQELGIVGSAVPDDLWRERLKTFKECGCNAIRTAHNPTSQRFLDICDEMGFLVQVEFFDEWDNPKDKRYNGPEQSVDYITRAYTEHFVEWAKRDLQRTIKRDINHPCIIQWGIGNEIEWTYTKYNNATGYFGADASGNYFWTEPPYSKERIRQNILQLPEESVEVWKTADRLSKWVKELDTTRPVVANCILPSASYESGYTDALDVVGYSYRQVMYEYGHNNYPEKPIMGTENLGQWHEWKHVMEKKYIPGIFIWAGIDYLGEVNHGGEWPMKGLDYGLVDYTGLPKHSYYMFKSLWQDEPTIHFATNTLNASQYMLNDSGILKEKIEGAWKTRLWQWHDMNSHWDYNEYEEVVVEVYSNCDTITLFLNEEDLGTICLEECEDRIFKWYTRYKVGTLKAVGFKDGCRSEISLSSAGNVAGISIKVNKKSIKINSKEVAQVSVQLVDEVGNHITSSEREITFSIDGICKFLGVDNGDPCNIQGYKQMKVMTYGGRCILLFQGLMKGVLTVNAYTSEGLSSNASVNVV